MAMPSVAEIHIDQLLAETVARRGTDLHLTVGAPPMIRVDGKLQPLDYDKLVPQDTQRLVYEILTDAQVETFEHKHELDFSHGVPKVGRYSFNVFRQRGSVGVVARTIPNVIPTLEEIGMPESLAELTDRDSGLVIVTGPTGSGKSTTLAALIGIVNQKRSGHVVTIENPIEYLHQHGTCLVNQREIGSDTDSFATALRSALREDPDVILVGEMRDLETTENALMAAETGHLVFSTLHTRNAPQAIDRIVDQFPPQQQEQIRVLLANTLEAVIAQRLLPRVGEPGRVPAVEVLIANSAVRALIREGKTTHLRSVIQTCRGEGMMTLEVSLAHLFTAGVISREEALRAAVFPDEFLSEAKAASGW